MKCDRNAMLLYAVTDQTWTETQSIYEQVKCALKGGVTCIQLREKELCYDDFLKEAFEVKELCKKYNVPFFVNDNVEVAIACKANGIHVGQHDMHAQNVRDLIGDNMVLGVSVQTVEQALLAEKQGADYLGVGAVFSTSTKLDADYVPYDELKRICHAVNIPVVAIGGIYKHNIMELSGSGIDGVALVSAIFAQKDIEKECKELLALSSAMVKK